MNVPFKWAVVGAGPAGILAISGLLDHDIAAEDIIWIDPYFEVGDFGRLWGDVSSNTTIKVFKEGLSKFKALGYDETDLNLEINRLPNEAYCQLKVVAEALKHCVLRLRKKVNTMKGRVEQLERNAGNWWLKTSTGSFLSQKVILATGAKPNRLNIDYTANKIALETALKFEKLSPLELQEKTVAVFGNSHSGMIILKNLLDRGCKRIVNFYKKPIRFAIPMEGWTLYDSTGLKAETAAWVKENILDNPLPNIQSYQVDNTDVTSVLAECDHVVEAIGFHTVIPKSQLVDKCDFDPHTGILGYNIFGCGLAFPRIVYTPLNTSEPSVGLKSFATDLADFLPIWMK